MSRILAYTSPTIGHLYPMTPLLLELRDRGHELHLRTLARQVDMMESLGIHTRPIDAGIEEIHHRDYTLKSPRDKLADSASVFNRRGTLDGPDLKGAIVDVQPDALLVDINCWGALLAAEASGLPWIACSPYIPPMSSPGTPPFGLGLPPMGGPLGRARDALVGRMIVRAVENTMLPALNSLRHEYGLSLVGSIDDFYRNIPTLLLTTAKPFEYEVTDWGESVRMIGACSWDPPQSVPSWLEEIDKPIILVTTSSEFQDDGLLVRTALEAFAGQDVHVVATMPAGLDQSLTLPANATVEEFVPHGLVLERAAVAITHGGMGATQKALSRGIPVCVVPFGRDQLEVARRVEVSKSGVRLPVKRLSPQRLRDAVQAAMEMTAGARRVAAGYAAAGGPVTGADALERRLLSANERVAV
jgi:MGT family glycosyltransferase